MRSTYCCVCGVETPCDWRDLGLGRIFRCPACAEIRAHVYPHGGGRAWITVNPKEADFFDLLDTQRRHAHIEPPKKRIMIRFFGATHKELPDLSHEWHGSYAEAVRYATAFSTTRPADIYALAIEDSA